MFSWSVSLDDYRWLPATCYKSQMQILWEANFSKYSWNIQNSNFEYNNENAPSGWIVTKFLSLDGSSDVSFAVQQQSNVLTLCTLSFESINAKQSTGLSPVPSPSILQSCHVFLGVPIVSLIVLFFGSLIRYQKFH